MPRARCVQGCQLARMSDRVVASGRGCWLRPSLPTWPSSTACAALADLQLLSRPRSTPWLAGGPPQATPPPAPGCGGLSGGGSGQSLRPAALAARWRRMARRPTLRAPSPAQIRRPTQERYNCLQSSTVSCSGARHNITPCSALLEHLPLLLRTHATTHLCIRRGVAVPAQGVCGCD